MTRARLTVPLLALFVALASFAPAAPAGAQTKLLRFPDIHGDRVAFSYGGDIWSAPATGGTATRLTAHPGLELFPRFSPDGKWIAFTGQYDGDEQVYVMPAEGGMPKQLTFYPANGPLPARWGYDNQVYGWSLDGKKVLFRSMRDGFDLTDTRLYLVGLDGGLPESLPMPVSGAGDLSPDGKKAVYSPLVRDFRTWKRYEGGWAQDLWIFDLATLESENITNDKRTDRDPMWVGEKIYFASDRTGTLNLYSYDPATKKTTALTGSTTYDVRWPGTDHKSRIVYELGGELVVYDIAAAKSTPISIRVPNDGVASRPSQVAVDKWIEEWSLSPKGERALFVARGDVFTVPIEKGPTRNLTNSSNAHDKAARWSPDGKSIAFISDKTGEEEIWVVPQDGSAPARQLTTGGKAMRYAPEWSSDGSKIAFSDKDGKLYVLEVASKKLTQIADDARDQIRDYTWSPDGRWLAFTLSDPNRSRSIWIWGAADGKNHRVTDEWWNEGNPVWDPEGNYLFFLSDHEFAPQISTMEWNYATDRTTGIYALALRKDVKSPFPPESDEVKADDDKKEPAGKEIAKGKEKKGKEGVSADDKKEEKKIEVRIDFDGLAERVARVPVDADDHFGLSAIEGNLIWVRGGPFVYGREAATKPSIRIFSMKERKEEPLADGDGYALSADGKKILVSADGGYALFDAKAKAADSKKPVSTKGMTTDRVPAEEWAQIFDEVWRRYRDWFYVPNMHGYDWAALRDRYRPLLAHVAHRADLNYLIGEMIAELNVGHAYIAGGDWEMPPRAKVALPGCRFEVDRQANRIRIAEIFEGQNDEDRYRSPLRGIGVDAKAGDYLLAIDGVEVKGTDDPYRLLRNKADRPVELTLNAKPEMAGARKVSFDPISSESSLRYFRWVAKNRKMVDDLSGGRVAYLHIPDMGEDGIREFIKWFYPQLRKEGLIVDDRSNGGGNVSQMIIERLHRKMLSTRFDRTSDDYTTYPTTVFNGPMVCLLNETSASDGDIFPAMFRAAGLGPLIGKRSWGGVVGISGRGPLVDGGTVFVPESATNSPTGEYIIEGHGVDPDIEVDLDPKSMVAGKDPQIERGVKEVLSLIAKHPPAKPVRPPDPVKTK
jgi:tricorn protease